MRIPRLSFPGSMPEPSEGDVVALDPAQSRHGLKSLRLGPGRLIELAGPWGLAPAVVVGPCGSDGRTALLARLSGPFKIPGQAPGLSASPESRRLQGPTLGLALVKGPRFDWAVEKAAELGAFSLVPILTERTASSAFAGEAKRSRWLRLSEEARKQCGRPSPMLVAQPARLPDFLASSLPEPKILLDPEGGPFLSGHGGPAAFLIGPEGGLTDGERAAALAHGFAPASLGVIKLKTETAALAALARWAKD